MAIEIQAPHNYHRYNNSNYYKVFLGGSIENGAAEHWQKQAVKLFKPNNEVLVLNPRRDDWNAKLENTATCPEFREQVEWELRALENADSIIMYFDPNTKAPISLLETGLYAGDKDHTGESKLHVVCPEPFYRKGNVDIVCERYNIRQHANLIDAVNAIKKNLWLKKSS